jgi:hypothetical protein
LLTKKNPIASTNPTPLSYKNWLFYSLTNCCQDGPVLIYFF